MAFTAWGVAGQPSFVQDDRLLRLHTPLGQDALLVASFSGIEQLFGAPCFRSSALHDIQNHGQSDICGFRFEIIAVSLDAHLDLAALLYQPVLLELLTQQSRDALRPFHGHVSQIERLGANGGFAKYRLIIEPWLAFLRYRQDSFLFQDKTIIDIVDDVLGDYSNNGPLSAQWQWRLKDARRYKPFSLAIQYNETDLAFLFRRLSEEGLYFWFEHESDFSSDRFGAHTLVIADDLSAFSPNDQPQVRYHRSDASEDADTIQRFIAKRQLQINTIGFASWDYKTRALRPIERASNAAHGSTATPMASYDHPGSYAYTHREDGERYAELHLQALEARNKLFAGEGTVRSMRPGTTFELSGHPSTDKRASDDHTFTLLSVEHCAHNNLHAELRAELDAAFEHDEATEPALYTNRFTAIRAHIPYRPLLNDERGMRLHPQPTVSGSQTALVVGLPNTAIHTERDHRIKIQFHWQRGNKSHSRLDHPSASNAPADQGSGTWVRYATPLAGGNFGGVMLPRIGQEVMVTFLEGDIDRPLAMASLYNGVGQDNTQSNLNPHGAGVATGNAPAWFAGNDHPAVLSGIKTQALQASQTGIGGYNQLVFDDTPKQARVSVLTTQHQSALNLGHLKQQNDNKRLNSRGHGFELATEQYGAIRAGQGLLLSTDRRARASSTQLDSKEAEQQLSASREQAETLAKCAADHQANLANEPTPLPAFTQLQHTETAIAATRTTHRGDATAYSEPALIASSPAGIACLTPGDTVLAAAEHVTFTANDIGLATQGETSVAVKDGISLFCFGQAPEASQPIQPTGITAHAAQGPVNIEAHSDEIRATAEKSITISSHASLDMAAPNHLLLTAGGAYIKLEGGNIEIHAPAQVTFKAGLKVLTGPGRANYDFPEMPISSGTPAYSERIDRRGVPETWLPMPASVQASAFKQTQRVTVLTSTGSTPETRSMLSKNADEVGYWTNLDADWNVETFFDVPNQYPDDDHD